MGKTPLHGWMVYGGFMDGLWMVDFIEIIPCIEMDDDVWGTPMT